MRYARLLATGAVAAIVTMASPSWLAATAHAHDPGLSSSVVTVSREHAVATLRIHATDLANALEIPAADVLVLKSGGDTIRAARAETNAEKDGETVFSLSFAVPREAVLSAEVALLGRLPRGHKHHIEVRREDGTLLASAVLSASAPRVDTEAVPHPDHRAETSASGHAGSIVRDAVPWLRVGLDHILEGYDHLLFVFALMLGAATIGATVRLVTAFTIGHSFSLALAATGVVAVPASIVEPAIAASIVVVALLALRGGGAAETLLLTFAFGLLHGLGFASALVEAGIGAGPPGQLLASVLCFNLGVEAGQLAFAALVFPLLSGLRRRPAFRATGVRWCSAAVAACGVFWLAQRVSGA